MRIGLLALLIFTAAGCSSLGTGAACTDAKFTCPLGTQKECAATNDGCDCRCHSLDESPFTPIDDHSNGSGTRGVENPSNNED